MAALTLPAASQAQVVMSALENVGFANGSTITIDIDGDLTNDFSLFANSFYASISRIDPNSGIFWNGAFADVFSNGSLIGPVFANEAASADFDTLTGSSSSGYVGVYFRRSGQTHAAWLHFDFTSGDPWNGVLTEAAWQATADASINAGAIPEPAHVATGFGLLAGIAAWWRRRRTAR